MRPIRGHGLGVPARSHGYCVDQLISALKGFVFLARARSTTPWPGEDKRFELTNHFVTGGVGVGTVPFPTSEYP